MGYVCVVFLLRAQEVFLSFPRVFCTVLAVAFEWRGWPLVATEAALHTPQSSDTRANSIFAAPAHFLLCIATPEG